MATVDLIMPKLGESITEATILKWHKKPGDPVKMDETVLDIATDKVDSEVPSTAEGTIESILFNVNDVVPIGAVIARIKTGAAESTTTPEPVAAQPSQQQQTSKTQEAETVEAVEVTQIKPQQSGSSAGRFYSPLVLNIAASEGISMSELEQIPGTGNEGRVTKKDILQYVSNRKTAGPRKQESAQPQPEYSQPQKTSVEPNAQLSTQSSQITTYSGNVEIIEMDRMRKLIADHMVRSKHTSPHVTSFTEADVTNLVMWRDKVKKDFEKREGTRITFTPLFIEAIVKCIKKFPLVNCSLDG
ncbi:MAG TPA: 2-oxo acid dehydrogenase subunit E2, partial [Chitinophagaceae bacterium]|nr:2-oxo acid dehydrogenase subunit E2 [Chitinophagaceae bacterium]